MIPTGGVSQLSGCCPPYGYHFIGPPFSVYENIMSYLPVTPFFSHFEA